MDTTTWNSRADILDRHILVSQKDARLNLDFQLGQGLLLRLGKPAHVALDFFDVFDGLLRDFGDDFLYLRGRELEGLWRPPVKPLRVFPNGRVAFATNLLDDPFDRVGNLLTGLQRGRGGNVVGFLL